MARIWESIDRVKTELAAKLKELGKTQDDIILVAITKTHPVETINQALKNGIAHIGENKVQEAVRKIPNLRQTYAGFHFVGHLQSNKINQLIALKPFLIHSIDSVHIAEKLNEALERRDMIQDILVQVNTTSEESKSGVSFENARETLLEIAKFPYLRIKGLMTIGINDPDPEETRPYFRMLKELFDHFKQANIPNVEMTYLSMGMSDDYLIALEEGSNLLRLGSILFGERDRGGKR